MLLSPITVQLCFTLVVDSSTEIPSDASSDPTSNSPEVDATIEQLERQLDDKPVSSAEPLRAAEVERMDAFYGKLAAYMVAEKISSSTPIIFRGENKLTIIIDVAAEPGARILNWFLETKGGNV